MKRKEDLRFMSHVWSSDEFISISVIYKLIISRTLKKRNIKIRRVSELKSLLIYFYTV